jgi:hypothetical protein
MPININTLTEHDPDNDCPVCRAQDLIHIALLPAAAAWEMNNELPQFSIALNGAAELLGAMLAEGVGRDEIETALGHLLDEIELRIAEDGMGGPAQGHA